MLVKLEKFFDRFSNIMGWIAAFLTLVMLANVFYDAITRYFFRSGSIALQEMEWHLFSVAFLFGMAYTLKEDGHVRVDILYESFTPRWKAIVNIGGVLLLLLPLSVLIVEGSFWYVHEAYTQNEISGDPGGLTQRWIIKSVIPAAFIFLIISSAGFIVRNIRIFRGEEAPPVQRIEDDLL